MDVKINSLIPFFHTKFDYNKKVFMKDGKKIYRCYSAQKHYKDESGVFQDIDTRLSFNSDLKSWKHTKASYNPLIPEYADGIFDFTNKYDGANFTLQFKPVASHVKGEYFETEEGNYVLYPDAFGYNIDLKVYSYWAGLKKVICINQAPKDLTKDLTFDFEIIEKSLSKISITKQDGSVFDYKQKTDLDFTDKTIKLGKNNKYTYFINACMWDSSGLKDKVNIQLVNIDKKVYIRKTIPKEFLQKATFPIYTDHPTNYFAGNGDGVVYSGNSGTWSTVHDASSGYFSAYTQAYESLYVFWSYDDSQWVISRLFFPIDTSGIGDEDEILTATAYFHILDSVNAVQNENFNDGNDYLNIVQTTQASTSSLANSDFPEVEDTEGCDSPLDINTLSQNTWISFALNTAGIGWINKTGYTKLGMRIGHDILDDAPDIPEWEGGAKKVDIETSEATGTNRDPYLEIITSAAPPLAPTDLTAVAYSDGRIDLTWSDNSATEDGFKIERSTNGVDFIQIGTVGVGVESYSDTDVEPNTLYYYRVCSYNEYGNSDYTDIESDTTFSEIISPASPYLVDPREKTFYQPAVLDIITTEPDGYSKGKRYLLISPTGAWSAYNGYIFEYNGTEWKSVAPKEGMVIYVKDEDKFYKYITSWTELSPAETATTIASLLTAATAKGSFHDNDTIPIIDSEASNVLKKNLWSVVKSTLKTYFDTLYQGSINILVNGGTVGTSGVGVIAIKKGTPPPTSPTDVVQLYADSNNTEIDYMEYASDGAAQAAYITNGASYLQSYSESTIKNQGTYSLKGVAAINSEGVNQSVTGDTYGSVLGDVSNSEIRRGNLLNYQKL